MEKLDTASNEQYTVEMEIDAEMAAYLLTMNKPVEGQVKLGEQHSNRRVKARLVNELANKIRNGKWVTTHQGIAFYKDGTLADGQHRLMAIEMAKPETPVRVNVTFGLPREAMSAIDTGSKRSGSDTLSMLGEADAVALQSALRAILAYEQDFKRGVPTLTTEELIDEFAKRQELRDYVRIGREMAKEIGMTPGPAVAAAYITDRPRDSDWYRGLINGTGLMLDDPRTRLRRMFSNAYRLKRQRPTWWQLGMYGKTYKAWEKGKTLRAITFKEAEAMPRWGRYEKH